MYKVQEIIKNYCKNLGKVIIYKITKKYTNKRVLKSPIGSCKKEDVLSEKKNIRCNNIFGCCRWSYLYEK